MPNHTITSKITKWGNSQAIRLPKEILAKVKLRTSDSITLKVDGDQIIIKKATPNRPSYKSLEELFANFDGKYETKIIDFGKPVGKEILDAYTDSPIR